MLNYIDVRHFYFLSESPVRIVSNFFGIAPFTVKKMSKMLRALNIALSLFWYTLYLTCFYFDISAKSRGTDSFTKICIIGIMIHTVLGFFMCSIAYLSFILKTNNLYHLIVRIKQIDTLLIEITGMEFNFRSFSNRFQLNLVLNGLTLYIIIMALDTTVYAIELHDIVSTANASFVNTFPFLASGILQAQFVAIIYAVLLRFEAINRAFTHIATINESTSKSEKVNKVFADESEERQSETPLLFIIGDKLKGEEENACDGKNSKKPTLAWDDNTTEKDMKKSISTNEAAPSTTSYQGLPKDLHKNMDSLFALHDSLLDISENINDVYALQIVAFITVSFVTNLFGFFFETKVIFWLWGKNPQVMLIASSYLLWSILTLLIIYTILTICTKAREAAYESALIVQTILLNKPVFMLNDEIYYNKMKSFTLQILHRKNTFNFNGLGLFQLDYTFIFSAVSAATSYLIVLLQFDLSADLN